MYDKKVDFGGHFGFFIFFKILKGENYTPPGFHVHAKDV